MHLRILAAVALVLAGSEAATGQADPTTLIGQRVRMRCTVSPHCFVVGTLVAVRADSAEIADAMGTKQTWALSDFDRVHRSLGLHGHPGKGLRAGAIVGFLAGAIVGLLGGDDFLLSAGDKAIGFGIALGLMGALIGAVAGEVFPTEGWEDVSGLVLRGPTGRAPEESRASVILSRAAAKNLP